MKTQTLELKHLAAYLPYGLIIRCGKTKSFDRELTHDYFNDNKVCVTAVLNVEAYKPILRPLSDLTKDIHAYAEYITTDYKYFKIDGTYLHPLEMDYNFITCLLENHFDVFGLIDAGLAIDINKLEDETNG